MYQLCIDFGEFDDIISLIRNSSTALTVAVWKQWIAGLLKSSVERKLGKLHFDNL